MGKTAKTNVSRDRQAIKRELQTFRFAISSDGKQLIAGKLPYAQFIQNRLGSFSDAPHTQKIRDVCAVEQRVWLREAKPVGPDLAARLVLGKPYGGHEPPNVHLVFSPDGRLLVSVSDLDVKPIQVWAFPTGKPVFRFDDYSQSIKAAFDPNGKRLAFAVTDGNIRLCDVGSGLQEHTLEHLGVNKLAFSPNGRLLASASSNGGNSRYLNQFYSQGDHLSDGTIRLWDPGTGQCRHVLEEHQSGTDHLAFSPDGKFLASAPLFEGIVQLWDPETGRPLRTVGKRNEFIGDLAFSPNGTFLASSSEDGTVWLWDHFTGKLLRPLTGHLGAVLDIAVSPDGKILASASEDSTIRLWDPETGRRLHTLGDHNDVVGDLAFSPNGRFLASASRDGTVRLWNPFTGKSLRTLTGHLGELLNIAFSPDGRWLVSASSDGSIRVWDPSTVGMTSPETSYLARPRIMGLKKWRGFINPSSVLSPDGRLLASISGNSEVTISDSETGECIQVCAGHKEKVVFIAFISSGERVVSASQDGTLRLWNPLSNTALPEECTLGDGTADLSHFLAVSSDGSQIAWMIGGSDVGLWNTSTGALQTIIKASRGNVPMQFSPDGKLIALVYANGYLRLCRSNTGETLAIVGDRSEIYHCSFSHDGRVIALGCSKKVFLWNRASRVLMRILDDELGDVQHLAFSPDGRFLASTSINGKTCVWNTNTWCLLIAEYGINAYRAYWCGDELSLLESIGGNVRARKLRLTIPEKAHGSQLFSENSLSESLSCFERIPEWGHVRRFHCSAPAAVDEES